MSIIIHYEQGQLIRAEMPIARSTPSPTFACSDGQTFAVGDIWGTTFEEVSQTNWAHEPDQLNNIEGAKAIVRADEDGCVFAVDMNGIDTFYYYCRNGRFVLSDSFWAVVRIVQPEYEDLDAAQIKMSLISASADGNGLIRGMKYLLPNHIGVYRAAEQSCEVRQYGERFHYSGEVTTVSEAVANMDQCLHHTMERIKEKCGKGPYGLGLSGGLDSRVIPYYALQHGLELRAFNTCICRPHGILKARNVKSSEALARFYQVPFKLNKWKKETFSQKMDTCLKLFPEDPGGCPFKYEDSETGTFSSMLSGGSGMTVGSELPVGIAKMTEEELFSAMVTEFFPSASRTNFIRAIRALSYITGIQLSWQEPKHRPPFSSVLDNTVWDSAKERLSQYIHERKANGYTNVDIYEDFFINVSGCHNRFGAHETLLGQKHAFSIYIPFMLKETLRWDPLLLENRVVLNTLIREKIPGCADIREESFKPSINKNPTFFERIFSIAGFLLRGNGAAIDQHFMPRRDFMAKYLRYINEESGTWFKRVFDIDHPITKGAAKKEMPRTNIRIWQTAMLLHCLETKQYMEWEI